MDYPSDPEKTGSALFSPPIVNLPTVEYDLLISVHGELFKSPY
jgi:hypothetical protein